MNNKYIILHGKQDEKLSSIIYAPILYRTKNIILHRHALLLRKDVDTKKRCYTISWTNGLENRRLFDVDNVSIKHLKRVCDIIQNITKVNLDLSESEIKKSKYSSQFRDMVRHLQKDIYDLKKYSNLYQVINEG